MYIRCADCQATTWIRDAPSGAPAEACAACDGCGHSYSLARAGTLGETARDQYCAALEFAERERIDLPSAYSVMLGIMTLPQAKAVRDRPATAKPAPAPAVAAAARTVAAPERTRQPADPARTRRPREGLYQVAGELSYDPGFRGAVADGTLTATQAMERGDREALAERLARLHGITIRRAYQVADNRVSIREARAAEQREREAAAQSRTMSPAARRKIGLAGVVAAMFLVATALFGWNLWAGLSAAPVPPPPVDNRARDEAPAAPANRPDRFASWLLSDTEVQSDEDGQVIEVVGPSPHSVLAAYCAADGAADLEPLELTQASPPVSSLRLGIFRDPARPDSVLTIRIRRDRTSRRWVAGDGRGPVRRFTAPAPVDTARQTDPE